MANEDSDLNEVKTLEIAEPAAKKPSCANLRGMMSCLVESVESVVVTVMDAKVESPAYQSM